MYKEEKKTKNNKIITDEDSLNNNSNINNNINNTNINVNININNNTSDKISNELLGHKRTRYVNNLIELFKKQK